MEAVLTQDEMRRVWISISPIVYFNKFGRWPKKSLMIYGRYDLTFLPEFSKQAAGEFFGIVHAGHRAPPHVQRACSRHAAGSCGLAGAAAEFGLS